MNKNFWALYKESKGKEVIDLFNPIVDNQPDAVFSLYDYSKRWGSNVDAQVMQDMYYVLMVNFFERKLLPEYELSRDNFVDFIKGIDLINYEMSEDGSSIEWFEEDCFLKKNSYRHKVGLISILSVFLYYNFEFFKPILLPQRFDIFQNCCDAIGLEIPSIPRTKDYLDYFLFYYDLCEAMKVFQTENGLSDQELCACIYDFGNMSIEHRESIALPKPTNVWITGASGKLDFDYLDSLGKNSTNNKQSIWACNERTRRGDIIVIYCTSPRSYIHSIWRANSGGFFNPFDWYQCRTTICDGYKVPQISFSDIKESPYFSELPIVRKNLQGVNGVELSAETYNELLALIKNKGGDIDNLPRLFEGGSEINFDKMVYNENDVEDKILVPLLCELGYEEKDWTRQLTLKAGRKGKAIPDFVFFPSGEEHFENAPLIVEAKYDMSSMIELDKAFRQALSYARMLRAKLMGICDKERVIIYSVDESGACNKSNPLFEEHWLAIYSDGIIKANLNKIIGREVVKNL